MAVHRPCATPLILRAAATAEDDVDDDDDDEEQKSKKGTFFFVVETPRMRETAGEKLNEGTRE